MVEPVSVVTTAILTVVPLIWNAALTARQNKDRCLELAERAWNLGQALPNFARATANDTATAFGLARLSEALGRALRLIESCQDGGFFRRINVGKLAADLDGVDRTISNCLRDLNFFSIAGAHAMSTHGATPAVQTYDYTSHHHQAQGGSSWPPQHASQGPGHWVPAPPPPFQAAHSSYHHHQPQGGAPAPAYHQPPGYAQWQWVPSPAPPAPSGSRLSSLFKLPTVTRVFNHVFR